MKDWKLVAASLDPRLPEADLTAIAPVLDTLEEAFRPLASTLAYEDEPALIFEASPEERL